MTIATDPYRAVFKDYQSQVLDNPSLFSENGRDISKLALSILGCPMQRQLKTEEEALSLLSAQCHLTYINFTHLYRRHTSLNELKKCKRLYEILVEQHMTPEVAAPLSMEYIKTKRLHFFQRQIFTYRCNKISREKDVENHLTNWNLRLKEGLSDPSCDRSVFEKVKIEFDEYLKSTERKDLRTILKTAAQFWPDLFPHPKEDSDILPLVDEFSLEQSLEKYQAIYQRIFELAELAKAHERLRNTLS